MDREISCIARWPSTERLDSYHVEIASCARPVLVWTGLPLDPSALKSTRRLFPLNEGLTLLILLDFHMRPREFNGRLPRGALGLPSACLARSQRNSYHRRLAPAAFRQCQGTSKDANICQDSRPVEEKGCTEVILFRLSPRSFTSSLRINNATTMSVQALYHHRGKASEGAG